MEPSKLRTDLGAEFQGTHESIQYPILVITKFGRELPLLLQGLPPGPLPIAVRHNESLIRIGSCSLSALELNKINRVYEYDIMLSETEQKHIAGVESIMEVLPWMVSLSS